MVTDFLNFYTSELISSEILFGRPMCLDILNQMKLSERLHTSVNNINHQLSFIQGKIIAFGAQPTSHFFLLSFQPAVSYLPYW